MGCCFCKEAYTFPLALLTERMVQNGLVLCESDSGTWVLIKLVVCCESVTALETVSPAHTNCLGLWVTLPSPPLYSYWGEGFSNSFSRKTIEELQVGNKTFNFSASREKRGTFMLVSFSKEAKHAWPHSALSGTFSDYLLVGGWQAGQLDVRLLLATG